MFATFTALSMTCLFTFIYAAFLDKILELTPEKSEPDTEQD